MTLDPNLSGTFPQIFSFQLLLLDPETFDCVANCADLRITVTPAPEPVTLVLLSTGLAGLGAAMRRWQKEE